MKPFDLKSSTHIDFGVKNNEKEPKFKVGDHVRMSKYKNFFAKGYIPNWCAFVKFKNTTKKMSTCRGHIISNLKG